ncbi:MAG: aminodeoxychorismate synthase component I [Thiohalomonadales bacterium]
MTTIKTNKNSGFTNQLNTVTFKFCPDLLSLHSSNKKRYPFLLQSTSLKNKNSRFDILFAFPQQRLVLKNNFKLYLDNKLYPQNNFLNALDELWNENKTINTQKNHNIDLPFTGGWFIYLAYELLGQIEEKVKTHTLTDEMNIAIATRIPAAMICDHKNNITHLVSENITTDYIPELINDFKTINKKYDIDVKINLSDKIKEEHSKHFIERIKKVKKYIFDGDIFQSNLSREWFISEVDNINSVSVYDKLRKNNPAAFSGIVKFDNLTIISSSPERLIRVKDGYIETRPIAGTTQRSKDETKDSNLASILLNHPKEKAEHVMLVDMERNDLSRVCKIGTIEVNEMMTLESLTHVHHIVSNIKGKLKNNVTPGNIINAVFPGGSITGCPKVRCMEIIHELEDKARNSYTGSMGYLNNNGDMDLNILIRTIEHSSSGITFRTGAGIVNDSEIDNELQETRNKAKGLLAALT